jgi:hypothetical protein
VVAGDHGSDPLGFSARRHADHGIAYCETAQFGGSTVTVKVRVMPLAVLVTVIV